MTGADTTAVYVAYRTPALDLSWIPADAPVVVVHNDDALDQASVRHPAVTHLHSGANVGFGAAVNAALDRVATTRVLLANPDLQATPEHWQALTSGEQDDVVSVPVVDPGGGATAGASPYPTPWSLVLTGWRVGRWLGRGSRLRQAVRAPSAEVGTWPLSERWVSCAVISIDTGRLRQVGGFDPGYSLYMEDVDLCRRLAARFPSMRAVVADVAPAVHAVSASSAGAGRRAADLRYARSTRRYAGQRRGVGWRLAAPALAAREWWLQR